MTNDTTSRAPAAVSLSDLVERGMLAEDTSEFLEACARSGRSIVVSGPTASGKTTLIGALSAVGSDPVTGTLSTVNAPDASAAVDRMLVMDAPVIVHLEQEHQHRHVESIHETLLDDHLDTPDPAPVQISPLWDRRSGDLAFTGTPSSHSAQIRADGWIRGDRPWLAA